MRKKSVIKLSCYWAGCWTLDYVIVASVVRWDATAVFQKSAGFTFSLPVCFLIYRCKIFEVLTYFLMFYKLPLLRGTDKPRKQSTKTSSQLVPDNKHKQEF